jgi:ABC-type spermidine/putrescine transport system permease subunit I
MSMEILTLVTIATLVISYPIIFYLTPMGSSRPAQHAVELLLVVLAIFIALALEPIPHP